MSVSLVLTQRNYTKITQDSFFVTDNFTGPHVLFVLLVSRYSVPGISKHTCTQRKMKKSVLIVFVHLQVFLFRKEDIRSKTTLLGQRISGKSSSLSHTYFILLKKIYIHVQLTVNHMNYSDSALVHEATIPWVENVNSTQFTACVTRADRNDYPSDSFATVDWVA